MIRSVFITGANAGLGKESARQLALRANIDKIYLGCRDPQKGQIAQAELEQLTGRNIFEVITIDVSNLDSVANAVNSLPQSVDALVMNAGGTGGKHFHNLNSSGVTEIFAVNLLGHSVLAESLLTSGKLNHVAVYAGSEAARGVEEMGMKRPTFDTSSVSEFVGLARGSYLSSVNDPTVAYGPIKYMGALWMSAMARRYPQIRFVTMSPGATTGTQGFDSLPLLKRVMMQSAMKVMLLLGKAHQVETGASRYMDAVFNSNYKSGLFYASRKGLTGELADQATLFADIANQQYQENAYQAIKQLAPM
ncbi:SDR family NAD(P)-dependent oxidoreductase [Shewanella maritima]|uniref:SDR family NAD(P)-dependent oxidoreductase n=1 Tax=Shewanella maritima TaxID=2520507 RepID=A0A411PD82_9GAMM|nr:SDR family NAD(P)-dependent oxidoreductase [Shewanella maritima]QBF81515.1 SDR family NAD(P)-dependent oxidoreductase [Shewanella maritima]